MTERLAARLSKEHGKSIENLNPEPCICSTMYCVSPADVLWVLDNLADGKVVNQITVPAESKHLAKRSLERVLELSALSPSFGFFFLI